MRRLNIITTAFAMIGAGTIGGIVASHSAGAATTTPAGVVVVNPVRVLDTRDTGKLPLNSQVVVNTGISGAIAAAVNITLTDTDGAGFVTAWDGQSARPNASIINSSGPGQTVANYTIVPITSSGQFTLFTSNSANLIVDFMGYLPNPGATPQTTGGYTAQITGYSPGNTITSVTGTVTNGTLAAQSLRVDIKCPNGTVETDYAFSLAAGDTKGFSVLCQGGAFTTGATVQAVVKT